LANPPFCVRPDASGANAVSLLACGQAVTNGLGAYVPGARCVNFINGTNAWQTVVGAASPQTLGLTLPHLGTASGVSRIELALSGVSRLEGWCVNGRFASGSQTGDDFSFAPAYDLRAITVLPAVQYSHANERRLLASSAHLKLFCKDTGGRCVLTATPYDGDGNAMAPVTVAIPADENGNGIADVWERDKVTQHNGIYPSAPLAWPPASYADPQGDGEPAALGVRRTDGTYFHADTGDGLSILDEYRGYLLDGGAGFTGARHVRLSPALKELLVQVNELPGMAQQPSFNPAALSAYGFNAVMQQVAQFYCHPTRGLGIDLYWVRKDFTAFGEQFTPDNNLPPVSPHRYRFNGNLFEPRDHDPSARLTNGVSMVMQDYRLITPPYNSTNNVAQYQAYDARWANGFRDFITESRDPLLPDFVKLILVDRRGNVCFVPNSGVESEAKVMNDGNAVSYTSSPYFERQGSCVCVSAMADEKYKASNGELVDYTATQFLNQLIWSIAHEIGHLLTAGHIAAPSGHLPDANVLMTDENPVPAGITATTSNANELEKVDLKFRLSVQH